MDETLKQTIMTGLMTMCGSEQQNSPRRWEKILPLVEADLTAEGIDIDPKRLPELMAKSITRESIGNKGICFIGNVGSGKSRRMKFLADAVNMTMLNAREMCAMWVDLGGNEAEFQEYCLAAESAYDVVPACFHDLIIDDIGTEEKTYTAYGTEVDVMRNIILPLRHAQFPRWRTFITTNLTPEDLKARYGARVFSRLNEMCIFVRLTHNDRRMPETAQNNAETEQDIL